MKSLKSLNTTLRRDRRARSDAVARSPRGERRGIQIGPRIRIGGTLGKIGQSIKEALPSIGPEKQQWKEPPPEVLNNPDPNALVAWQKMQGEIDALDDSTRTNAQRGSLIAGTALGAQAAGAFGGGAGGAAADGAAAAGASSGGGVLGTLGSIAGKAKDALGGLGDAPGGGSLLDKGLLAAAIADAAANKKKQGELQDQALGYATDAYSAKQPLRSRGLELLQDETAPDLSSMFANPHNRYSKTVPTPQVGTRVPLGEPVLPKGGTY